MNVNVAMNKKQKKLEEGYELYYPSFPGVVRPWPWFDQGFILGASEATGEPSASWRFS
jgi:hypothetical protein